MLLALFPLSGGFKACALTEGEIFYADTHSNAVNSFTGGAYRSGGNTVRFLKTKTNEKICYCIQSGVVAGGAMRAVLEVRIQIFQGDLCDVVQCLVGEERLV